MVGKQFWKDLEARFEAFLSSNRPSEAPLKASAIKYACEKGSVRFSYNPPIKIFNFDHQCERETGRASQADVTPNGVGGYDGSPPPRCTKVVPTYV